MDEQQLTAFEDYLLYLHETRFEPEYSEADKQFQELFNLLEEDGYHTKQFDVAFCSITSGYRLNNLYQWYFIIWNRYLWEYYKQQKAKTERFITWSQKQMRFGRLSLNEFVQFSKVQDKKKILVSELKAFYDLRESCTFGESVIESILVQGFRSFFNCA